MTQMVFRSAVQEDKTKALEKTGSIPPGRRLMLELTEMHRLETRNSQQPPLKPPQPTTKEKRGRLLMLTAMQMVTSTTDNSTGLNNRDSITPTSSARLPTLQALVCFSGDVTGTRTGRRCTPRSSGSTRLLASTVVTSAWLTRLELTPLPHATAEDQQM